MAIIDRREVFRPFSYPKAHEYWLAQQQAHWLHTEVSMADDISDWYDKCSEADRQVAGWILKGFTQLELPVNDYWGRRVTKWFPLPEIAMMATAFSNAETIHMNGYAYLNESLPGQDDFEAFLHEPTIKAKLDRLIDIPGKTKVDIARSLAIFSGFTEGVQLFSSFAVLLSFKKFNKLKGLGTIVSWSIKDEALHSEAGCWLFRTFIEENPTIWTPDLQDDIYEAARLAIQLEDDFIDRAFSMGDIQAFTAQELKAYIRFRANAKLQDLGLKTNWRRVDQDSANKIVTLMDELNNLDVHRDFFDKRVSEYSKGVIRFDSTVFDYYAGDEKQWK